MRALRDQPKCRATSGAARAARIDPRLNVSSKERDESGDDAFSRDAFSRDAFSRDAFSRDGILARRISHPHAVSSEVAELVVAARRKPPRGGQWSQIEKLCSLGLVSFFGYAAGLPNRSPSATIASIRATSTTRNSASDSPRRGGARRELRNFARQALVTPISTGRCSSRSASAEPLIPASRRRRGWASPVGLVERRVNLVEHGASRSSRPRTPRHRRHPLGARVRDGKRAALGCGAGVFWLRG